MIRLGGRRKGQLMTDYFVDPVSGDDVNDGTDPDAPFASVARGLSALDSGDVLNLHAGSTYGPTMVFSSGLPDGIVVQPYAGDRVLVDGRVRFPDLGVVPNEGWERVVDGHPDEWRTRGHLRGADPRRPRPGAVSATARLPGHGCV